MSERWLPVDHPYPQRVEIEAGVHMRPIRADDVELDYPAVMGSQETLWRRYGESWGWPPATMTLAQDRDDLERHEREIEARESFNYAVLDAPGSRLLGCVYLDPPAVEEHDGHDVVVSWWLIDNCRDTPLAITLAELVPRWVTEAWPFERPLFAP